MTKLYLVQYSYNIEVEACNKEQAKEIADDMLSNKLNLTNFKDVLEVEVEKL